MTTPPSGRNGVLQARHGLEGAAAPDALVDGHDRAVGQRRRGRSATRTGPPSVAAAARSCDSSANSSSCCAAQAPALGDHLRADALVEHRRAGRRERVARTGPAPARRTAGRTPTAEEPIGTRDIDSTPPATTTSYWPATRPAAAKCHGLLGRAALPVDASCPGTDSGQPAASTALRPMLNVCSPTWDTQPQITSSTTAGSMPGPVGDARAARARTGRPGGPRTARRRAARPACVRRRR